VGVADAHPHVAGADSGHDGGPAPYRILVPGKVYRRDNPDPTHNPMFHQVEGLLRRRGGDPGRP